MTLAEFTALPIGTPVWIKQFEPGGNTMDDGYVWKCGTKISDYTVQRLGSVRHRAVNTHWQAEVIKTDLRAHIEYARWLGGRATDRSTIVPRCSEDSQAIEK